MQHDNAVSIARIEERITELAGNYKTISKSYKILNECHTDLELQFTIMETEWRTAKNMITWVAGGSLISLVIGVLTLAKLFNVI